MLRVSWLRVTHKVLLSSQSLVLLIVPTQGPLVPPYASLSPEVLTETAQRYESEKVQSEARPLTTLKPPSPPPPLNPNNP